HVILGLGIAPLRLAEAVGKADFCRCPILDFVVSVGRDSLDDASVLTVRGGRCQQAGHQRACQCQCSGVRHEAAAQKGEREVSVQGKGRCASSARSYGLLSSWTFLAPASTPRLADFPYHSSALFRFFSTPWPWSYICPISNMPNGWPCSAEARYQSTALRWFFSAPRWPLNST